MRALVFILSMMLTGPGLAQDVQRGAELYGAYCAACHGAEATGDGPMAEILAIAPPDLTALSAGAGGEFPLVDVVRTIDGRNVLLSHGGPMPLFGAMLGDESAVVDGPDGTPVITKQSVVDMAAWLASVQR